MSKIPKAIKADISQVQLERRRITAKKQELIDGLPHLYGWNWYRWAYAFFESQNRTNLLCAANQISKSSTQIRKAIHWATSPKLWPGLWKTRPRTFWYFYPTAEVADVEFNKKWVEEFLPRGSYKVHSQYGWRPEKGKDKLIDAVHFNSGVSIYFRAYSQKKQNLQTTTVWAMFCDEELPVEYYDELRIRMAATDGYFHMVFTATLSQDLWYRAMEVTGENELFPQAFKQTISMYDCLLYKDGSPSPWTEERIKEIEATCQNEQEVARRVHGRFVRSLESRKYGAFDPGRHFIRPQPIPTDWKIYSGTDIGTGGNGHPAAISFIAVRPDYRMGWVFRGWRGDGVVTTGGDILAKFQEIRGSYTCVLQGYDSHAKDFSIIAARIGEGFTKSEKKHEIGEDVINTLFRNDMLYLFETDELLKLGTELSTLSRMTPKNKAKDDFCDSLRYAAVLVPWDWTAIKGEISDDEKERAAQQERPLTEAELLAEEIKQRRGEIPTKHNGKGAEPIGWQEFDDECGFWNELYGN